MTLRRWERPTPAAEIEVATDAELPQIRQMMRDYQAELGVDLCFQDFETELEQLPGPYARPAGALLYASRPVHPLIEGQEIVGIAAFKPIGPGVCELKRFYVRPDCRQLGIASLLLDAALNRAVKSGYREARLDTLRRLGPALTFYERRGFLPCEAYVANPESDVVYLSRPIGVFANEPFGKYLDWAGRIAELPESLHNPATKGLWGYLAGHFETGRKYREAEVNAVLDTLSLDRDPARLRRELVDRGCLNRTPDGKQYWRD